MGSKFDTIFVANVSALALEHLAPLGDGSMAWVQSVKRYYSLDKSSGLAPDGITIIQPITGSPIAGVPLGRWIAQDDGTSFATQAAWWIDPIGGNDQNAGLTALAPIKTWAEFMRRIDGQLINQPTVISIMNDVPVTDPVNGTIRVGNAGLVTIKGTKTPTVLHTGTFTAVVDIDPLTNQPQTVTDASIPVSWGASGLINTATSGPRRIRLTGGANVGATAWASFDLGAKTARTSGFLPPINDPADSLPTVSVSPIVGDAYVVETGFVVIQDFSLIVQVSGIVPPSANPLAASVLIRDLTFGDPTSDFNVPTLTLVSANTNFVGGGVAVYGCDIGVLQLQGTSTMIVVVSCKLSGFFNFQFCPFNLFGGLCTQFLSLVGVGGFVGADFLCDGGGQLDIDAPVVIESAAVFDSYGDGVGVIFNACAYVTWLYTLMGPHSLYGSGNAGVGIKIRSSASLLYYSDKPTITGVGGDTIIGGTPTAYAAIPYVELGALSQINLINQ